jgi:hypothetical protein
MMGGNPMNSGQEQVILELRTQKLTPKQIARKLGLKVSEVSTIIRAQVEETALTREAKGELPPIAQCLINKGASQRLLHKTSEKNTNPDEDDFCGFASILVARTTGYNRFLVSTYLVDYWCLGVKDTIPPRHLNGTQYQEFVENLYSCFPEGYQEISLEEAQSVVLGAVDYAATLGLSPHADFEQSKAHLGQSSSLIPIEFGHNGKPFFVNGPYDNVDKILEILNKQVGEKNFEYLIQMG